MAVRLAGTGCPVTIVGQTVKFAPWDVDWEWYSDCLVDGTWFIYNITRAASSAITVKTGTEIFGYTFGVGAIPAWVSGDRCIVSPAAAVTVHATIAAMQAAAAAYDTCILAYATATGRPIYWEAYAQVAKPQHVYGHLSRQRCGLYTIYADADQSANVAQVTWRNFSIGCLVPIIALCYYRDTGAGKTGGGLLGRRLVCWVADNDYGFIAWIGANNVTRFEFCFASGLQGNAFGTGFGNSVAPGIFYNCTALFLNQGFNNFSIAGTWQNNAAVFCAVGFANKAGGAYNKCADFGGATGSEAGLNNLTWAQGAFWGQGNNNGFFGQGGSDMRIVWPSVLRNAGVLVPGLTADVDGTVFGAADTPIGWHKGTAQPYNRANTEIIRGATKRGVIL